MKLAALPGLVYRDQLFPRDAYRQLYEAAMAALPEKAACKLTVDILALAHDRGCVAELATLIAGLLAIGALPDMAALRERFSPDPATLPHPDMLVGAGTVLTEAQADAARAAGAMFALSPGIDRAVLDHAAKISLPFAPGIMTPSDLQVALRADCKLVKFFPAVAAGGLSMLKNIVGPYLHTGIGFNPTGGVTRDNLTDWLGYAPVRAVGGTWIATSADIAAENWGQIRRNAAEASGLVRQLRGG